MTQAITAMVIMIMLVSLISFSLSIAKAQEQNQTLNEPENVNLTSSDKAVHEQTNVTSDNRTILATNGNNNTSANGTNAEILTNASQQPQALLQPLSGSSPAPSQSQQQPNLQQPLPPLPSPPNVIPSPLQQLAQTLMQPSQQSPSPPLMQPSQQQPFPIIPPPSTPLYQVPSFPSTEFNYQPPVILSQSSYVDNIGSMHIVGEVLNQALSRL